MSIYGTSAKKLFVLTPFGSCQFTVAAYGVAGQITLCFARELAWGPHETPSAQPPTTYESLLDRCSCMMVCCAFGRAGVNKF